MDDRLRQQLTFITEIDKVKSILRQTLLADGSRRENDAEHSWHIAIMAMLLEEYAAGDINITRVLKMALIHDLIEIYAGDTFAYDAIGNEDKEKREKEAADRLFALAPDDQGILLRTLWEEFDARETADAQYANAMDRFQPLINNYLIQGHTWKLGDVVSDQVYNRMSIIKESAPALWPAVEFIIEDSISRGYLRK